MIRKLEAVNVEIATLAVEGISDTKIAEQVGLSRETVNRRKHRPDVIELMDSLRAGQKDSIRERAKKETTAHLKKNADKISALELVSITPILLLTKLWEFANIAPEKTRYNTTSQQQAVDSIWTKMGFKGDAPRVEDLRPEAPDVYQAEWMRKPQ